MKRRCKYRVTYQRALLVTFGLIFCGVILFATFRDFDNIAIWPFWAYPLALGVFGFGVYLIRCGLTETNKLVIMLSNGATQQSESLIVMLIALPVYMVMLLFEDKK